MRKQALQALVIIGGLLVLAGCSQPAEETPAASTAPAAEAPKGPEAKQGGPVTAPGIHGE